MNKLLKTLGFLAIVLLIGFLSTCGESGANTDLKPNLSVPSKPSDIPNFNSSKGYVAIQQAQVDDFIETLTDLLDDLVSSIDMNNLLPNIMNEYNSNSFSSLSRSLMGRSIVSESIDLRLSNDVPMPAYTKITGYVKGTVSLHEENIFPITINGDSKARVEISEGFILDDDPALEMIGVVTGSVAINNVRMINENSISGSVSGTLNYALNIAYIEENFWVKVIGSITLTSNLSNETVTATAKLDIYGDSSSPYATQTITLKATPGGVTINY
ncbi:MAG: hypothetical protein FWD24_02455 [Treponema sp.]|nr:hypothetical protein [Treponema sp.]